ncbi:hypothetical protein [Streptomyces sp. GESEQ-4]|uniref:hypothetical protein n=1 Tax=Streptomyces sp. GESEQ-4 TaxID=2812655 RepID=UPI001B3396F8|nr:hypothetical protein [Streptomyces sp. GESEQ-4]
MAAATEELIPALEDARLAHTAVLDRFRADARVTPPGPHRQMLENRTVEVQYSVQRIRHQVRELQPRGAIGTATGLTRSVASGAVRTAMLPFTIGTAVVRRVLPGGGPADARQQLRNAEDEYAAAARALAASRAGEVLAEHVDDQPTADLLGSLRRQDEELLQSLESSVAEHARAVAASTNGSRTSEDRSGGLADSAAQTIWTALGQARDLVQRGGRQVKGVAEGVRRETPRPGPMSEEFLGAVKREEDLPITGFSQLSTDQIRQRLRTLSQADLTVIEVYEREHAHRKGVLEAIEQLRGAEPWARYDAMDPSEITARLQNAPSGEARQVRQYEQRHMQRQEIISAAEARLTD